LRRKSKKVQAFLAVFWREWAPRVILIGVLGFAFVSAVVSLPETYVRRSNLAERGVDSQARVVGRLTKACRSTFRCSQPVYFTGDAVDGRYRAFEESECRRIGRGGNPCWHYLRVRFRHAEKIVTSEISVRNRQVRELPVGSPLAIRFDPEDVENVIVPADLNDTDYYTSWLFVIVGMFVIFAVVGATLRNVFGFNRSWGET
jgi:hypothetical protein